MNIFLATWSIWVYIGGGSIYINGFGRDEEWFGWNMFLTWRFGVGSRG